MIFDIKTTTTMHDDIAQEEQVVAINDNNKECVLCVCQSNENFNELNLIRQQ